MTLSEWWAYQARKLEKRPKPVDNETQEGVEPSEPVEVQEHTASTSKIRRLREWRDTPRRG
jgi:hypothetical protein